MSVSMIIFCIIHKYYLYNLSYTNYYSQYLINYSHQTDMHFIRRSIGKEHFCLPFCEIYLLALIRMCMRNLKCFM